MDPREKLRWTSSPESAPRHSVQAIASSCNPRLVAWLEAATHRWPFCCCNAWADRIAFQIIPVTTAGALTLSPKGARFFFTFSLDRVEQNSLQYLANAGSCWHIGELV
jgi:hypothetical protein